MLLIGLLVLAIASVPLTGGDLGRLVDLRFRRGWVLVLALALKLALIVVFREGNGPLHGGLHVVSYLMGGYFLWANRRMSGVWLVALGGGMNFLAIAANGGVMPSTYKAFASAGLSITPGQFSNSAPMTDPNLAFLGDMFATPSNWPLANVFSIGDVCIVLGIAIALHRLCNSRLIPSGDGQFVGLMRNRDFMNVWRAQGISNLGDWVYSLAALATVAKRGGGAHTLAVLLLVQVAPAAIGGLFGGPLVDRANRKVLMVATDVARAAGVASLLVVADPSLPHLYLVAAFLGLCGALFQPALQASIPNLVERERVVAANAMISATYNFAVMAGPVVGGFLVAKVGPRPAFAVNAISFLVSGWFMLRARIPHRAGGSHPPPMRSLMEGFRYARATPFVRGALLVVGFLIVSAALRTPLEPLFVMDTLGLRPEALGLVGGAWGLGMLLGSMGAPAAARRWRREQVLYVSIAAVGVCILVVARTTALSPILMFWVAAGAANGIGSIAYDSLLQERTPDRFRGRVMAASEAVFQAAFLAGVSLSGWFG
ncbi:MAG TPA: MFS transporter, partial [Actinomycetota bacterium]|nr:MFS transporter [Actinomycetota bacterium]